jgi:hypothetical protein
VSPATSGTSIAGCWAEGQKDIGRKQSLEHIFFPLRGSHDSDMQINHRLAQPWELRALRDVSVIVV